MAPPPGRIPSSEPSPVPRRMGPTMRLQSSRLGSSRVTGAMVAAPPARCSRLRTISPSPNTPMPTTTKAIPSAISGTPKVKRCAPVLTSVPHRPSSRPSTIMPIALSSDPWASTIDATSPSTMSAKYSAGPNARASSASAGPASASSRVAIVPATNEAMAAVARATPARPWRARGCPSRAVTTEEDSSGQVDQDGGGRAAVLGAVVDAGQHDQRRDRRQGEGRRQQHRDGGHRPQPGQDAHQGAEQDADEADGQVGEGHGRLQAQRQVGEELHGEVYPPNQEPKMGMGTPRPFTNTRAQKTAAPTASGTADRRENRGLAQADPITSAAVAGARPAPRSSRPKAAVAAVTTSSGRHANGGSDLARRGRRRPAAGGRAGRRPAPTRASSAPSTVGKYPGPIRTAVPIGRSRPSTRAGRRTPGKDPGAEILAVGREGHGQSA